jgi:hypothetical protein
MSGGHRGSNAMHRWKIGNAASYSGNGFSSKRRCVTAAAVLLAVAATAPHAVPSLGAQSAPVPAVRVQRDLAMNGIVWPVDLNRDGITDLVSTALPSGMLQVSIGNGDGTFRAPVESSFRGAALGVGDFNGDGRPDVMAYRPNPQGFDFAIVPGTGTATLGAAVIVDSTPSVDGLFAVSADLDGDGRRAWCCRGRSARPSIPATATSPSARR